MRTSQNTFDRLALAGFCLVYLSAMGTLAVITMDACEGIRSSVLQYVLGPIGAPGPASRFDREMWQGACRTDLLASAFLIRGRNPFLASVRVT
jgi:hypothetical protein